MDAVWDLRSLRTDDSLRAFSAYLAVACAGVPWEVVTIDLILQLAAFGGYSACLFLFWVIIVPGLLCFGFLGLAASSVGHVTFRSLTDYFLANSAASGAAGGTNFPKGN